MSGAVTSTTTVATDVPETSANSTSLASPLGPTASFPQLTLANTHGRVANTTRNALRNIKIDLLKGDPLYEQLPYPSANPSVTATVACVSPGVSQHPASLACAATHMTHRWGSGAVSGQAVAPLRSLACASRHSTRRHCAHFDPSFDPARCCSLGILGTQIAPLFSR